MKSPISGSLPVLGAVFCKYAVAFCELPMLLQAASELALPDIKNSLSV
jgi:hypothetical protein